MPNMGYCEFRNTRSNLNDCLETLKGDKPLSSDEAQAGRWMFGEFLDFCREHFIIADYDTEEVQALFENRTRKEDDDDE